MEDNKKTWTQLCLFLWYRQTPCNQTSKSPRLWREHQLLLLVASLNLPIFRNKNKANASLFYYVFYIIFFIGN